ncbi:MAG: type II 3-dehydroquinate dehydratase [Armatimonadota bacterium]
MQLTPAGPMKMLVLHGPNLNLLGVREPEVYGAVTFDELNRRIQEHARSTNIDVRIEQSNHEGVLIDHIHESIRWADAIVINAGGFTHTSVAIADALKAVKLPAIEVHLSNVHARETFRHRSFLSPVVVGQIAGFGPMSYLLALEAARSVVAQSRS